MSSRSPFLMPIRRVLIAALLMLGVVSSSASQERPVKEAGGGRSSTSMDAFGDLVVAFKNDVDRLAKKHEALAAVVERLELRIKALEDRGDPSGDGESKALRDHTERVREIMDAFVNKLATLERDVEVLRRAKAEE